MHSIIKNPERKDIICQMIYTGLHLPNYIYSDIENILDWDKVSEFCFITEEFLEEFQDKINWKLFSKNKCITEDIMKKYHNKVDWLIFKYYHKISESFQNEFQYKFDEAHQILRDELKDRIKKESI